jgi:hypothetical protein
MPRARGHIVGVPSATLRTGSSTRPQSQGSLVLAQDDRGHSALSAGQVALGRLFQQPSGSIWQFLDSVPGSILEPLPARVLRQVP